jgi:hypothetical protein
MDDIPGAVVIAPADFQAPETAIRVREALGERGVDVILRHENAGPWLNRTELGPVNGHDATLAFVSQFRFMIHHRVALHNFLSTPLLQ